MPFRPLRPQPPGKSAPVRLWARSFHCLWHLGRPSCLASSHARHSCHHHCDTVQPRPAVGHQVRSWWGQATVPITDRPAGPRWHPAQHCMAASTAGCRVTSMLHSCWVGPHTHSVAALQCQAAPWGPLACGVKASMTPRIADSRQASDSGSWEHVVSSQSTDWLLHLQHQAGPCSGGAQEPGEPCLL